MRSSPSIFQRLLLPGLAFKAAVIGGGYATGRELAEFFLPSGPRGGLLAMLLAGVIWSVICSLTFQLAFVGSSFDYRSFFQSLLGRFWFAFEIVYVVYIVVLLAVFGAAAGAIGTATLGWPAIGGTLCLMACITLFAAFGNQSVDRLFKYVSFFLYGMSHDGSSASSGIDRRPLPTLRCRGQARSAEASSRPRGRRVC